MRISAVRFMFVRGVIGGAALFMLVMLLSSAAGWQIGLFRQPGFNAPANSSTLLYFLIPFLTAALAGGLIGLINGLYIQRFINRRYTRIFDVDDYVSSLGWRNGLLTAALSAAFVFVLMLPIFSTLPGVALVVLAGVNGGIAGRSYADHDMRQRREKKQSTGNRDFTIEQAKSRLELDETEVDVAALCDESLFERSAG